MTMSLNETFIYLNNTATQRHCLFLEFMVARRLLRNNQRQLTTLRKLGSATWTDFTLTVFLFIQQFIYRINFPNQFCSSTLRCDTLFTTGNLIDGLVKVKLNLIHMTGTSNFPIPIHPIPVSLFQSHTCSQLLSSLQTMPLQY